MVGKTLAKFSSCGKKERICPRNVVITKQNSNTFTYSKDIFREAVVGPPDPSLELLNFSTGVSSTPESDGVLFFSSMMSPSEQERLCLRVKGLLAGRGNTLAMSKVPLFDFAGLVDSDLLFCTKKKASAFLQAIFTLHCLDDWLKSLSPLLNKSDAQQKKNRLNFLALRHFHAPGLAIQISSSHWSSTRKSRLKF